MLSPSGFVPLAWIIVIIHATGPIVFPEPRPLREQKPVEF
jgi:hypothetical protein